MFRFDYTKLTVGTKFYEKIFGKLVQFTVTIGPVIYTSNRSGPIVTWKGCRNDDPTKEEFEFQVAKGYEHYGPSIYLEDEILEFNGMLFTSR